jgi:cell division transport system permease protein
MNHVDGKHRNAVALGVFDEAGWRVEAHWPRVEQSREEGGGVVAFLLVTTFLITLIVIGLNISLHQDEIEIMRLVGATSGYIRAPFIFEGVFYGLFSAVAATTFLWLIFALATPSLQRIFAGIPILPASPVIFGYLLIGEVLVGAAIGVVGSLVATRRYLNI